MSASTRRRFFFHYNKHTGFMTVHYRGVCIPVKDVKCLVPVETKYNKTQPRLVLRGWAEAVTVHEQLAVIQ
jgi:hypothetical protein